MSADASTIDPKDFRDIDPGERLLMGPGPSDVPARVLQADGRTLHWAPGPLFPGNNERDTATAAPSLPDGERPNHPFSATGSAGMEACFVNVVETAATRWWSP